MKVADKSAEHSEGSEYIPSREVLEGASVPTHSPDDFQSEFRQRDLPIPPASPDAPTSSASSESSDGLAESSESSTFNSSLVSSHGPEPIDVDAKGAPQIGGVEMTKNPKLLQQRFVSELAYHKFKEW